MACKCGSERIMYFCAKCNDEFGFIYKGKEYDGYVPNIFSFNGFGDYVQCGICLDCGQIQDWVKVDEENIMELVEGKND